MAPSKAAWNPDAKPRPITAGLTTVPEIPEDVSLPVTGKIPSYVNGRLFRNGPGVYEVTHKNGETTHINHWFDGIATVHRFRIDGDAGTVSYKNRRTMPKVIADAESADSKSAYRSTTVFGNQDPCRGLMGTLFQMWRSVMKPAPLEGTPINSSVTLERIPGVGKLVARTDLNAGAVLDIDTLENKEDFSFGALNPALAKQMSAAHGARDPDTGEYFNYVFSIGPSPVEYSVFAQKAAGEEARVLAKIREPACYLHSLAATKGYVILALYSIVANPLKLLVGTPYSDSLEFKPRMRTKFYVVSRTEAKVAAVYDADAFFCFHTINAFEEDGDIHLDLSWYENADVIGSFYRRKMVEKPYEGQAIPKRFTLADIAGAAEAFAADSKRVVPAVVKTLADVDLELPRISPLRKMRAHRYVYGVSSHNKMLFNSLVKADVEKASSVHWTPEEGFCGEPIFVPNPDGADEDEGVLLSVVLDAKDERSYMVVLDAQTMKEVGRATVPQAVPLGFHGQFMDESFATGPAI